jgi:hypothetical protein
MERFVSDDSLLEAQKMKKQITAALQVLDMSGVVEGLIVEWRISCADCEIEGDGDEWW